MTKPRVVRIESVPGRPEMNGPAHAYGVDGWVLMTRLVYAGLTVAGEPAHGRSFGVARHPVRDARRAEMTGAFDGLPRDHRDFLLELTHCGARFLVVGGWAMAAHGHPADPCRQVSSSRRCIATDKIHACPTTSPAACLVGP